MAVERKRTHFLIALIAPFIDSMKRVLVTVAGGGGGGAVSGSSGAAGTDPVTGSTAAYQPAAAASVQTGTGFATAGQVVTTTEPFTAGLNQYAGHWFLSATQPPAFIVSHPAAAAGPLVLTVEGLAPTTDAGGWRILAAVNHAHGAGTLAGPSHTHGAGTYATPSGGGGSIPAHHDADERTVSVANATSLNTSLALTKALLTVYAAHRTDLLHHHNADTTNTVASAVADVVDLPSAITAANQLKAAYNAHLSQSGVHWSNDGTNVTTAPDATDQTSLNTLLNEMKGDINAHFGVGITDPPSWRVVG